MGQRTAQDGPFFNVYVSQQGSNFSAVGTESQVRELQAAIHEGRPFGLWARSDGGVLTGITCNPSTGGLVLNLSPALRIPLRADGQVAQSQGEVAKWLEPWEQPAALVQYPAWSVARPSADQEPPHLEAVVDEAPAPPGPPGSAGEAA